MMDYSSKRVLSKQPRGKKTLKVKKPYPVAGFIKLIVVTGVVSAIAFLCVSYAYPALECFKGALNIKVRRVIVEGNSIVSGDAIIQQAGISKSSNLLLMNLDDARRRIMENPYIKKVEVMRSLPDDLIVKVVERKPFAILREGGLWYVDDEGVAFKEVNLSKDKKFDYPVITGVPKENNEASSYRKSVMNQALRIIKELVHRNVIEKEKISEVNFCEIYGFSVYLGKKPYRVILGFKDVDKKVTRLKTILLKLSESSTLVSSIDMDFKDKAIVKLKRAI